MEIFLGSSKTGLRRAEKLKKLLESESEGRITCTLWSETNAFRFSYTTIENLIDIGNCLRQNNGKAILLFTPDDKIFINYGKADEKEYLAARDNVIFELGLFWGILGQDNVICVRPGNIEGFRILSDWNGVNDALYEYKKTRIEFGLKEVAKKIIASIQYGFIPKR